MTGTSVLKITEVDVVAVTTLLRRYGLECVPLSGTEAIPGSYWGDSEAGLVGARLYWRSDTPLHSVLHEASHFICMSEARRAGLHTDAGGDYDEENGVCYLQILLADELPGVGRTRMCSDMDAWGYTFRLGSAWAWFEQDATDARAWLAQRGVIDGDRLTGQTAVRAADKGIPRETGQTAVRAADKGIPRETGERRIT